MQLNRRTFRHEAGNDIFAMDIVGTHILVNNNYDGLLILGPNLELVSQVAVPSTAEIYHAYVNSEEGIILYYCAETSEVFCVSVVNSTVSSASLPNDNSLLSLVHWWCGTTLVVATHAATFLTIDSGKVTMASREVIERQYPTFYRFWLQFWLSPASVIEEVGSTLSALRRTFRGFEYLDYNHDVLKWFPAATNACHQVTSNGTYILYVAENDIIATGPSGRSQTLHAADQTMFRKASFVKSSEEVSTFVVLVSHKSDNSNNWIELYDILPLETTS